MDDSKILEHFRSTIKTKCYIIFVYIDLLYYVIIFIENYTIF